jgi:flagellar biosynthesis/type III secretory pathway chaperone
VSRQPALAEILEQEADLYEALLAVLGEEESALLHGQAAGITACLARKEALVLQIRLAETSRQATVMRLTGRSDARLGELPAAEVEALGRARARLGDLLPRVERRNRRVEALLARAVARLRHTVELVREAAGGTPRYTPGGELVSAGRGKLDGRI